MWFTIIWTISVVLSVVIVYYLKEKAHRCQLIGYEIIIIIISDDSSMFLFIMPLSSIIVKSSNNLFFSPVFRLSPSFFQTFSRVNRKLLLHTASQPHLFNYLIYFQQCRNIHQVQIIRRGSVITLLHCEKLPMAFEKSNLKLKNNLI